MKVLATVKRVVDPDVKVKLTSDGDLDLGNVEYKLNPFDEYGIEEAVRLKEKGQAEEVIVCCIGTSDAEKEIRSALAMGADRGILVKVDDPAALDSLHIAKLIAAVIEKEEPGIVLMGKLSVDSENNQVGQMVAALADLPQGTFAFKLEVADGWATVGREVDGGTVDVKIKLPAVITADLRLNEPRYASLPGIMKARKKPLDVLTPDELDVELEPEVAVVGYELPPERAAGVIVESVDELIEKLANDAKVI